MAIKWEKIDKNPVKGIRMFKEKSVERYLEEGEITALLKACDENRNKSLKAIVITSLNTGMRLREILGLKINDLDFTNSIINIEDTKNGDRGKIPMNEYLKGILQSHLEGRIDGYVYCHQDRKPYKDIRSAFTTTLSLSARSLTDGHTRTG